MSAAKATAVANPNIAFVKYWGNADPVLHLPANPSISMNLDSLSTVTTVVFLAEQEADEAIINDAPAGDTTLRRVTAHLDQVRALAGTGLRARVVSRSNFPAGAGLASSASAFAALTLAATAALRLTLTEEALSTLGKKSPSVSVLLFLPIVGKTLLIPQTISDPRSARPEGETTTFLQEISP